MLMEDEFEPIKRGGLDGAFLKHLALLLMLVNHTCAIAYSYIPYSRSLYDIQWYITRPAFIIFAYFIAEGMRYTKSRPRYMLRLLVTAVISEPIYDRAFYGQFFYFSDQNVYFDLLLGCLMICAIDIFKDQKYLSILIAVLAAAISFVLYFNYNILSVAVIYISYIFRDSKKKQLIGLLVAIPAAVLALYYLSYVRLGITHIGFGNLIRLSACELHAVLALPLLAFYNGERGIQLRKIFYYGFYPVHLLLNLLIFTFMAGQPLF